jgi:cellulose synthase/poly-beta-1,6-N-acetylglucosamine synthase-like glycosyltransferase
MSGMKKEDDKKSSPPVSVILLSMNRKEMLESCLRSVQKQTFPDVEFVYIRNQQDPTFRVQMQTLLCRDDIAKLQTLIGSNLTHELNCSAINQG